MPSERECRTCREPMSGITLLDREHSAGKHVPHLEYTVPVAKQSFWGGRCGEVRFFGRDVTGSPALP